jgi:chromatin structure-remodeling complex subunit RSC1/2
MPIPSAQKTAIEEVINKLKSVTQGGRYKRSLIDAFLELPDREEYPDYYKVIPEPRCITDIQQKLAQDQYENCLTAFEDLALVFLNALYYNEDDSQIAADADKLKVLCDLSNKSLAARGY